MKRSLLVIAFAAAAVVAVTQILRVTIVPGVPPVVLLGLRWIALAAFAAYALVRRSLTAWILVGLLAGAEIGHDAPATALHLQILGQIFLRLIKTIVAPLLFATLVSGIAGHADLKKVGRMGIKALILFEIMTTAALFIGLAAINIIRAGEGIAMPAGIESAAAAVAPPTASDLILKIFPDNIAKSISEGELLQVVVFSLIFGVALGLVKMEKRRPMLAFAESLAEVMFKFTNIVMLFAPLGVAGAMAYTVAHSGIGMLGHLLTLLGALYAALVVFLLTVLLPVALLARIPLGRFIRAMAKPATIAFATTSSEAALPSAMEETEAMGVPREAVAFIIPLGYSFNLTGGTLYLALASIFVAQAGGLHLALGHQLLIMLALMLASKGIAGVSRGAIVVLMGLAPALGLPAGPLFVLLGIDPLMDMGRTAVSVIGNCLAAAVIARWEHSPLKPAT